MWCDRDKKMLRYECAVYTQDVWQVYRRERDKYIEFHTGYLLQIPGEFYPCYVDTAARDNEIAVQNLIENRLQKFETQAVLSDSLLVYLKTTNSHAALRRVMWYSTPGRLLYEGVPVPLLRDDFPNRNVIIFMLETHIIHEVKSKGDNESPLLQDWYTWKEQFTAELECQNRLRKEANKEKRTHQVKHRQ